MKFFFIEKNNLFYRNRNKNYLSLDKLNIFLKFPSLIGVI